MLTITETKGEGFIRAVADAGHWIKQRNRVWESSDDAAVQAIYDNYSLGLLKAEVKRNIDKYAKELRDKVTANNSPGEMASWSVKLTQAESYQSSLSAADAPLLQAEANARSATIQSIVDRVIANSNALLNIEAAIAGNAGAHKDAIDMLTTFSDVAYYDFTTGWPAV